MRRARRKRRALIGSLLVYALCAGVTGLVLWFSARPAELVSEAARTDQPLELREEITIGLQPLDTIPPAVLLAHAQILRDRFGAKVQILEPRPLPVQAYSSIRGQANALTLLDDLYVHKPPNVSHIVGVTRADLFSPEWEFLYGFAQTDGAVAVYSTARLGRGGEPLGDWEIDADRAAKIVGHEVAHTLGLGHCTTTRCVMATVEKSRGVDHMSRFFCNGCARQVQGYETPPASTLETTTNRGDGLFARAAFGRAQMRYVTALLQRPTSPEILNRVGVASAEVNGVIAAERAYRLAILLDPAYPLAYYNYGLLYARVDVRRSAALLHAGFDRDPDRVQALGFLGSAYAEVLGDEFAALHYFQEYVAAGGHDAGVLLRYRRLVRPGVFAFHDAEVDVIKGREARIRALVSWYLVRLQWALGIDTSDLLALAAKVQHSDGPGRPRRESTTEARD